MLISIVNCTHGRVADEELHRVVRAINRQVRDDFCPYWSMGATLRLEGHASDGFDPQQPPDMRGDAVITLWSQTKANSVLGYHDRNFKGIPFGVVFLDLAEKLGEPWSVTLSHEVLELIADPEVNLLVRGPHPQHDGMVFHAFEMCDAVQAETYEIDGVAVSNFVLPAYFTGTADPLAPGIRADFLQREYNGKRLQAFGINPGGYINYFDPYGTPPQMQQYADAKGRRRNDIKQRGAQVRRMARYAHAHTA